MNYPVWQLDFAGGGLLIAVMAVIHVYIAQFAVGGGLFLVLTEHKALRENNRDILEYVKKHTKFFLLLTMVLGSLTGVGIWFTISVLNPAATSVLIHTFVFAWGVEWLFFVTEIISLLIYYYTFDRLSARTHLIIGWIYFGSAWMSLFVINGIIDFMLTPGNWPQTGNFWHGFFNPTFWPALFFRSFLAVMIAGLFGFVTASFLKKENLRLTMLRFSAKWLLVPFVLFLGAAWWYRAALPPNVEELIFQRMPEMRPYISAFVIFSPLLILGGLLMAIRLPSAVNRSLAAVLLIIGLMYLGAFEFIREGGRKPYIIYDHMYSNSIFKNDVDRVKKSGILQAAKWVDKEKISGMSLADKGREVFQLLCIDCHSIGGPINDIKKLAGELSQKEIAMTMPNMGRAFAFMPPFVGTDEEKKALTFYIHHTLLNRTE